jgi:chorismate mutase/prephenate dehydratase
MAKRTTSKADLQKQIERMDRALVRLLGERTKLVQQLLQVKKAEGGPLYDDAEEQEVLRRAVENNKSALGERCVRAVFRELVGGSRALAKPLRVAYLGPQYSYSYLAAVERFGHSVELAPVAIIAAVFEEVNRHHADFGIVPIENSTDGRIVDTLDMFARQPVRICGEVQLRIHHNLLGKCQRSEIREVYSKPQALSQCRDWLAKHLPAARTVEMNSTATAAQLAAEKPGAAAIASVQAAVNYGLDVIAANIEDNRNNITRFAVIGDQSPRRTGNDKTSLMFEIPHQPGSLADAMQVFKRNRLNLTWIESFPMSGSTNEYLFFVEFEGHHDEMKAKRALAALEKKTVRIELLGSYAKTAPIE